MDFIRLKSQELYQRNALGSIASHLFPNYGEFFALPPTVKDEFFELLSVFVKRDDNTFEYAGNLRKNGAILTDQSHDILHILRPHLHSSSKKEVDRYLIALKSPFSRRVHELLLQDLAGRPEGKLFSWIDLGRTQIDYVDPVKLATRIQGLKVSPKSRNINGKTCIYVVNKVFYSDRLHYYPSKEYATFTQYSNDKQSLENQIKDCIKSSDRCCLELDKRAARAITVCRVLVSEDGTMQAPTFDIRLMATNPYRNSDNEYSFCAQELDFAFLRQLRSQVQGMRTKCSWQPALRQLFSFPSSDDRQVALQFLLEAMKTFQTEDFLEIQLVDFSSVFSNPPNCLSSNPSILASFLRGVGILLTAPQHEDDGEIYEEQIVFQPANCQENLRILKALLAVLVKGVITEEQALSVSKLQEAEVESLQELFFTQMGCICSPWKTMNPRERPLCDLWKRSSRTRCYLESLGFQEVHHGKLMLVICPEDCQLLNILALFYDNID